MSVVPFKRTKVITSKAQASAIIERIANKHDLTVAVALCAKRDRYAVACRAEIAWTLKAELNWSLRRIGEMIGITGQGVRKLLGSHEIARRRAHRSLPQLDLAALATISRDELRQRVVDLEAERAYLQSELDRLTGQELVPRIVAEFKLESAVRCAIVLAILAEHYPRVVGLNMLIELYDETCDRMNYGQRMGANSNLMAKNVAKLREHFEAMKLPDPVSFIDHGRRLTPEIATILHERLGAPRLTQLRLAHSSSVPQSMTG